MLTKIRLTEDELRQGALSAERVQFAKEQFLAYGCLKFENAFRPELITSLRDDCLQRCSGYLEDREHADALTVGDKRFMVTLTISGVFNDPEVYAPRAFYQLLTEILGPKLILNGFGAVLSLPGAADQQPHRDGVLYDGTECDGRIPPFAVTVITPLVALNPTTGATRLMPGSHRIPQPLEGSCVDPVTQLGACFLMDYTLLHCGMANRSAAVRPVLYSFYSRPWFRDHLNYSRQDPLVMGEGALDRVPAAYRHLFSSVNRPTPVPASSAEVSAAP